MMVKLKLWYGPFVYVNSDNVLYVAEKLSSDADSSERRDLDSKSALVLVDGSVLRLAYDPEDVAGLLDGDLVHKEDNEDEEEEEEDNEDEEEDE